MVKEAEKSCHSDVSWFLAFDSPGHNRCKWKIMKGISTKWFTCWSNPCLDDFQRTTQCLMKSNAPWQGLGAWKSKIRTVTNTKARQKTHGLMGTTPPPWALPYGLERWIVSCAWPRRWFKKWVEISVIEEVLANINEGSSNVCSLVFISRAVQPKTSGGFNLSPLRNRSPWPLNRRRNAGAFWRWQRRRGVVS